MSNIQVLPQINLPAEIVDQFAALGITGDDLDKGVSAGFPVVSIRGAKWRISEGGEEHPVYIPGTTDLAPSIKVVLLKANQAVSKTFYASKFEEGSDAAPDCFSSDGIRPSAEATKPQAATCAACPHNQWGSKITDAGKKTKACADVRRTAILPAEDLDYSACLLRIPAASLADLAEYGRQLKKRGIPYTAVVTKLSFDPDASYPKINFTFERVLEHAELVKVAEKLREPVIEDILGLRDASAPAAPAPAPLQGAALQQAVNTAIQSTPTEQLQPMPAAQPAANEAPPAPPAPAPSRKSKGFGAAASAPAPAPAAAAATQANTEQAKAAAATPAGGGDLLASLEKSLAGLKL